MAPSSPVASAPRLLAGRTISPSGYMTSDWYVFMALSPMYKHFVFTWQVGNTRAMRRACWDRAPILCFSEDCCHRARIGTDRLRRDYPLTDLRQFDIL